ncbi:MAG: hypothetical protein ACREE4_09355 [Stellaceae bacterium]
MPLTLYVIGFIVLAIPGAIVGLMLGGLYAFFRYILPALRYSHRKRIARERVAAQQQAERERGDFDEVAP